MALSERPLWEPKEAALYWIDIAGLAVHRYDPKADARWRGAQEPALTDTRAPIRGQHPLPSACGLPHAATQGTSISASIPPSG